VRILDRAILDPLDNASFNALGSLNTRGTSEDCGKARKRLEDLLNAECIEELIWRLVSDKDPASEVPLIEDRGSGTVGEGEGVIRSLWADGLRGVGAGGGRSAGPSWARRGVGVLWVAGPALCEGPLWVCRVFARVPGRRLA
jgi:hypothetical protein